MPEFSAAVEPRRVHAVGAGGSPTDKLSQTRATLAILYQHRIRHERFVGEGMPSRLWRGPAGRTSRSTPVCERAERSESHVRPPWLQSA